MKTLIAFAILAASICLSTATWGGWGGSLGWGGYGGYGHSIAIPVASYGYGHGYSSPSYALSYGHGYGHGHYSYPSYSHGGYYGSYWKK